MADIRAISRARDGCRKLFLRQNRLLGGNILDQVDDFIGITPLFIVPRNHFHESVVEGDAGVRVKYGSALVAVKVR